VRRPQSLVDAPYILVFDLNTVQNLSQQKIEAILRYHSGLRVKPRSLVLLAQRVGSKVVPDCEDLALPLR